MPVPSVEECLLPVLKALARDEGTHVEQIRERVAAELNVAASERQEPGPNPGYPRFDNRIAHALKRLRSGGGGYGLLTGKDSMYGLTADGADLLAGEPTALTFDYLKRNYPVKAESTQPRKPTAQKLADFAFDPGAAWDLAGQRLGDDDRAERRIADREAMLQEVQTWPDAGRSSREVHGATLERPESAWRHGARRVRPDHRHRRRAVPRERGNNRRHPTSRGSRRTRQGSGPSCREPDGTG